MFLVDNKLWIFKFEFLFVLKDKLFLYKIFFFW